MTALRPLRLSPKLRPDAYQPFFRTHGRLHIPDVLDPGSARVLHQTLSETTVWMRSFRAAKGRDVDMAVAELESLPDAERAALEFDLAASGEDVVRHVFDRVRVSSDLEAGLPVPAPLLDALAFVNSKAFLDFITRVTGDSRVGFADMMAARYLNGHFLTTHGDENPAENRLFAYVLTLARDWRADWGGILMFLDGDGHVSEGYVPAYNALNLFAVPQLHAVSAVSRLARGPRLSVTGWIHARP